MAKPSSRHLAALRRYLAAVQQWEEIPSAELWKQPELALPIFTARPVDKKLDEQGYRNWIRAIQDRAARERDPATTAVCAAILKYKIPPLAPAKEEK